MYRRPFTVTPEVLGLVAAISRLVGRLEGLPSAVPQPKLRKRNRVRTIRGTLAIEGAGLPERQVTALLEGKRVMGGRRQILEVTNAVEAYARAPRFAAGRVDDLLAAHAVMMLGLIADAGRFALLELTREIRPERATAATRRARARAAFGRRTFSRGDYLGLFPALSAPTASRDLRDGVDDGSLLRTGDKATTRYRFRAAR